MISVAKESDKLGIAKVHYQAWLETYKGLIHDDYLSKLSVERSFSYMENVDPSRILVAKEDGEVIGFIKFGKYRSDEVADCGEIESIYILKKYQKRGIGKKLIQEAINKLSFSTIYLWVLDTNTNAINFYIQMGFEKENVVKEAVLVSLVKEIRMKYKK